MPSRDIVFTGLNLGTMHLRGVQVAQKLGASVATHEQVCQVKDSVVVAIKWLPLSLAKILKHNGNIIILDVLDKFARKDPFDEMAGVLLADHLIYSSTFMQDYWSVLDKPSTVIHHHWDPRIIDKADHDRFRIGYIGASFNHGMPELPIPGIYHPELGNEWAPKFNCHWNMRDVRQAAMKPATKVVTAAAVEANILTIKDPASFELLGDDYPYYIDEKNPFATLQYAQETFNGSEWRYGLDIIRRVREKTSLDENIKLYEDLLCEYL